jgi:hypothetical protein
MMTAGSNESQNCVNSETMERDFKGVWIPKQVWLDERLNALEKIILVEIDSLDGDERGCYASNKYLAEFCQCSETKISKAISKLIELGYLYVQNFDGRQRELRSRLAENTRQNNNLQGCLAKNARQNNKKCKAGMQKMQDNNINNNIDNKIDRKERKKEASKNFDSIISDFAKGDKKLESLLKDFLQLRFMKKQPVTNSSLKALLDKLSKYAYDVLPPMFSDLDNPEREYGRTYLKRAVVEKSLINGYSDFYRVENEEDINKILETSYEEYKNTPIGSARTNNDFQLGEVET